jgi:hypothetical protein
MTVINSDNIISQYTSSTDLSGSPNCIGYTQVLDVSSVVIYNNNYGNYFIARLAPHNSSNWDTSFNVTAGVYLCIWNIYLYKTTSNYTSSEWFNTGVVNGTSTTPTSYTLTYNGKTYTNLYDSGTYYSASGLAAAVVSTGSCVINTVGSLSKSFTLLCESRDINNISIVSGFSFFQYTRIA